MFNFFGAGANFSKFFAFFSKALFSFGLFGGGFGHGYGYGHEHGNVPPPPPTPPATAPPAPTPPTTTPPTTTPPVPGYSVTFNASATLVGIGQSVTLTATANQNVGPTPYGLSIVDKTTGVVVAHISSGTTVSALVTESVATSQAYVGEIDTKGGPPIAATAGPINVVWTSSLPSPITRAASFPVNNEVNGLNTLSITPQKVGDLVVVSVQFHSTSLAVASVSGGNVGGWQRAERFVDTANNLTMEIWYGTANAVGTALINITYSSPYSSPIELVADSFTSAAGTAWNVVANGGVSNSTSPNVVWPTLTSETSANEIYWGSSEEHTTGTGIATPGFTSSITAQGNEFIYDPALATRTAYSPIGTDNPSNVSTTVGAIFSIG